MNTCTRQSDEYMYQTMRWIHQQDNKMNTCTRQWDEYMYKTMRWIHVQENQMNTCTILWDEYMYKTIRFFYFFLRGRFIDINKLLYRIVEEKKTKENALR